MAKEIPLTRGKVAIVDEEDYEWLVGMGKWRCNNRGGGYAMRTERDKETNKRRTVLMHRVILGITDPKIHIDHIDGNSLNNTRANLRVCTQQQNNMNARKRKKGASQYKGVCFNKGHGKWQASIKKDGKRKHLGYFTNEIEAARAYNVAASSLFGEFAQLNQIEGEC